MNEKGDKKRYKASRGKRRRSSSSTGSSQSDEWVEKEQKTLVSNHDDWMAMTGMLKTYSKERIKPKQEKEEKTITSYNPSTSSRELNPYWKDGGTGIPKTPEEFCKSRPFVKPTDDDNYYKSYSRSNSDQRNNRQKERFKKPNDDGDSDYYKSNSSRTKIDPCKDSRHERSSSSRDKNDSYEYRKSYQWKQESHIEKLEPKESEQTEEVGPEPVQKKGKDTKYLSDEKMNKLAAKIVKAEIMGDYKLVEELKVKLKAAREYRKQNLNAGVEEHDDGVMLMSTNTAGNSRPLSKGKNEDPKSKGGKRRAATHDAGQRNKYFGNDDKYNLAQMFEQEKYGNNYDDEAQLAKIAGKHTNPNDDLEDIFVDEISKNINNAKDSQNAKQKAIRQHVKMERSLEGCEFCVDSKNMFKHLMVTCGNKVYLAVPGKQSLVNNQCILTTIQHTTCVTALDEDVWEEILNFRKALTQFFNSQGQDVVFFETATRLHRFPHMVINCVPLPRDIGDMAAIYFKKALLECEAEWSMNKKVVELKGKSIRKGVPKGLPYFWVDFGMEPGFAHVIEDQTLFPKLFAEEIIGGMLDLDHRLWKNPKKEYGDLQRKKVLEFIKVWKPFENIIKNTDID